jgi:hypothetical protein
VKAARVRFTEAQVRRAVKAAQSAGLRVRRVTVTANGEIRIDGETEPVALDEKKTSQRPPASWDD